MSSRYRFTPVGGHPLQFPQPRRERLVEQVAAVEVEDVEEPGMQHRLPRCLAAEPRHRLLKRPRGSVLVQRERFAVQDEVARGHAPHRLDDLGHAVRDVREAACVRPDIVSAAVRLDARTAELVLDRVPGRSSRAPLRRSGPAARNQ
ncbi:hypothetical protein ATY41_02545 [Leifsonia xyli subsp. xyli]|uniref:Uncharacterized protein n=1 Tax=Leifsonia xyli subsp. xyli TaxID=59736 RepID=A0A1E2SJC3_LEIXY|nr:hypothetical protein ATY41_02545 [Leifsonia xyli subsp. xyli]